jgi:hypothetical protein
MTLSRSRPLEAGDFTNIVDEFTHECVAIKIDRPLKAAGVSDALLDLFVLPGILTRALQQRLRVHR